MKTAFGQKCGTHISAFFFFCDAIFKSELKTMPHSQRVLSVTGCGDSIVCRHYLPKKVPEPSQKVIFSISPSKEKKTLLSRKKINIR